MAPQFTNSCYCRSPHIIYTPTHQDHGDVGPFPCHYGLRMNGLGTTHYSLLHVNHLYASNLLVSHLLHCLDFSWYCLISASMLCTLQEDLILAQTNCLIDCDGRERDSLCGLPQLGGAVDFYHLVIHGGFTPLSSAGSSTLHCHLLSIHLTWQFSCVESFGTNHKMAHHHLTSHCLLSAA